MVGKSGLLVPNAYSGMYTRRKCPYLLTRDEGDSDSEEDLVGLENGCWEAGEVEGGGPNGECPVLYHVE